MRRLTVVAWVVALVLTACAGQPARTDAGEPKATVAAQAGVTASDAAARFLADMPQGHWGIDTVGALRSLVAAGAYVIDVREPSEYAAGHIGGAVNIPLRTLTSHLDRIPQDRPVVIYCRSSYRAGIATTALHVVGYTNVRDFVPAFIGWEAAKEPISKDAAATVTFTSPKTDAALVAAVDRWLSALPGDLYGAGGVAQLKMARTAITLVDVRESAEYMAGHIPGATSVPIRDLVPRLGTLPKDKPIALYSSDNHRAGMALAALHLMGVASARGFHEGYEGWKAAGEPIEADRPTPTADDCGD